MRFYSTLFIYVVYIYLAFLVVGAMLYVWMQRGPVTLYGRCASLCCALPELLDCTVKQRGGLDCRAEQDLFSRFARTCFTR